MTERRQYRLLCPISRSLDVLGDRWTLLILRDLHAGPARFQELQEGLGIATNLLSARLKDLLESELVERSNTSRSASYRLTESGRTTDRVLWELARFGGELDRDDDPREPGNLRAVALPLRIMLEAGTNRPDTVILLRIDEAEFTITSKASGVDVEWGRTSESVDLIARTNYAAFLDVGEGVLSSQDFALKHLEFEEGSENAGDFYALFADLAGAVSYC